MTTTMLDALREHAQTRADAPYVHFLGRSTSYGSFWDRTLRTAAVLQSQGVGAGDRVAVLGKNSDRLLEVVFGAAAARATAVILNWRLAPGEWQAIVADSGARLLVADPDFAEAAQALAAHGGLRLLLTDIPGVPLPQGATALEAAVRAATPLPASLAQPDDDFLQLYTSGTTGKPKGVPQTHRMHLSQRAQFESFTGPWSSDERFLGFMPFFHAAGITFPLFTAGYGTQIEVLRMLEPPAAMEALSSGRITATAAVPTILAMLLPALAPGQVKGLRRIFYGASAIDEGLLRRAIETLGCDFWQVYAATETTSALTMLTPADHRDGGRLLASCGRPSPLAQVRTVDAQGHDVATGSVGEVMVKSDSVLRRYWHNDPATRAVLADGWYRTGDLGRRDAQGYLFLVDRAKDMIITGGENVYPAEVELVLAGVPGVAEQAVVGLPDAHWGEVVTACVVAKPEAKVTLEAVRDALKPHLAGYKLPKRLEVLTALPRNAMGKVQKHVLRSSLAGD